MSESKNLSYLMRPNKYTLGRPFAGLTFANSLLQLPMDGSSRNWAMGQIKSLRRSAGESDAVL